MEFEFRKYRSSDFEELALMVLGLYSKDGQKATHMTTKKVALSVENLTGPMSLGQIFIFEKAGEPIGYSIVNRFWSNEFSGQILYVDELYVMPEHRSQGVGAHFFDFLQTNPENHSVAFMLETMYENEKAIEFYKKIGFNPHHNYLMFKQLV
jgi:ribosomal protein S18 acetylase RimI-like enzyme